MTSPGCQRVFRESQGTSPGEQAEESWWDGLDSGVLVLHKGQAVISRSPPPRRQCTMHNALCTIHSQVQKGVVVMTGWEWGRGEGGGEGGAGSMNLRTRCTADIKQNEMHCDHPSGPTTGHYEYFVGNNKKNTLFS